MRSLLLLLLAWTFSFSTALADVPDPDRCECTLDATQRLLLIPDGLAGNEDVGAATFTVTVLKASGLPLPGADVWVVIGGRDTGHTKLCGNQAVRQYADGAGMAVFNIAGGGCFKSPGVVDIYADGIRIRRYDEIMSPDYRGSDDAGMPDRWRLAVDPAALAAFVASFQGGVGPSSCHDYDNDGVTGGADLAVFVAAYRGGANACSP